MLPLFVGSNSNNNVSSTTTLTYSPEGKPSGNFEKSMKFPVEEALVCLVFVLILVSMTTCTPKERKCDVIHQNAPSLKKCEIW
jgi:hypothetical protein